MRKRRKTANVVYLEPPVGFTTSEVIDVDDFFKKIFVPIVTVSPMTPIEAENPIVPMSSLEDDFEDWVEEPTLSMYTMTGSGIRNFNFKQRFLANIEAIKLVKGLLKKRKHATPAEQKILSEYCGWGGLSNAFIEGTPDYMVLKEVCNEEEFVAARSSVNTAFYTPAYIARELWKTLLRSGFKKGNILEPSMGTGVFFGTMPHEIRDNSVLYGVELDRITAQIAKELYPRAKIEQTHFESYETDDNMYDLIISNIPFGDIQVYTKKYQGKVHEVFLEKALDLVRPGGYVIFIVSKFFMDAKSEKMRRKVQEKAELIAAVRLPSVVFSSAGTSVTSDILFLKKREKSCNESDAAWMEIAEENGIIYNRYFIDNPSMILGTMKVSSHFGITECVAENGEDIPALLSNALGRISFEYETATVSSDEEDDKETEDTVPANPNIRNYTYADVDGTLYYRENSVMRRVRKPGKIIQRIRGMRNIADILRQYFKHQTVPENEECIIALRKQLNEEYDRYVAEYGFLLSKANRNAFCQDADFPLVSSLEEPDETKADAFKKTDAFFKRTVNPTHILTPQSAEDALIISLNMRAQVDLDYMDTLLNRNDGNEMTLSELKGKIYHNPETCCYETAEEYLSGNVVKKLEIAMKAAEHEEAYKENVTALRASQPEPISAADIYVRIGTPWITVEDYTLFLYETLNYTPNRRSDEEYLPKVVYSEGLNTYKVYNKNWFPYSPIIYSTYGSSRMDMIEIFEKSLNQKAVKIYDTVEDGYGKKKQVLNREETIVAREKQEKLQERFKSWFWKDKERRDRYEVLYNKNFNNIRLRRYDGSMLQFPGMNPEIRLHKHQLDAIARGLFGGNVLLAHAVGAGKSFELIAICMKAKQLGIANKPMLVVPSNLTGQMAAQFLHLYPMAKVLVATTRDFQKINRKRFIAKIAMGDWDGVIIGHSQFERIGLSNEFQKSFLAEQISLLVDHIATAQAELSKRWSVKMMEKKRDALKAKYTRLMEVTEKDDVLPFDELGIDMLCIDEAHNYKNLEIESSMERIAGITSGGSIKAYDLYSKIQFMRKKQGERGIVFATGTPISNTMCEMYVLKKYLAEEYLKERGLDFFDKWAAQFGETTTALELAPEGGGYRFRTRFNRFVNLPELLTIYHSFADVKAAEDLDIPKPDAKIVIVESVPDKFTKKVMESFVKRAERIHNGGVKPSEDNMLKLTHEARLLGTDARLLMEDAPVNPDGKLFKVVNNIMYHYNKGLKEGKIAVQAVFSDIGTPKKGFNVYDCLKGLLIQKGVPENKIAFAHDATTDVQRENLRRKVVKGEILIIIGSTQKLGTGMNIQDYVVALHHVDVPWTPDGIEQRDGRGLRPGNIYKIVTIYRYVTSSTFDAYLWGTVENKARFIHQVSTSKNIGRSAEDIGETVLSYGEVKAVASGDDRIRRKIELDTEVSRLKMLQADHRRQLYEMERLVDTLPYRIDVAHDLLQRIEADYNKIIPLEDQDFSVLLDDKTFDSRVAAGGYLEKVIAELKPDSERLLGRYLEFSLIISKVFIVEEGRMKTSIQLGGNAKYTIECSQSGVGTIQKISNFPQKKLIEILMNKREELHKSEKALKEAKDFLEHKDFVHEKKLASLILEQNRLDSELSIEYGMTQQEKEVD